MKKILIVIIMLIMITGCKKEEIEKVEIVKYEGGKIKIEFKDYIGYDNKTIEIMDEDTVKEIIENFNYAKETTADYRGPSPITYYYINEKGNEYSFKIWEEGIFEFAELNIDCPDRNCSKYYETTNESKFTSYALEKYN
ncbi:MAG: hypothetical protein GX758_04790 [Tenericutes bacterium]|nr:hypothetical protein [Mycoplasmatota bacterium]